MSPFRLVALGVGDAFSARHYSSCLALEAEDTWLLIDCPHPIRKMMREASALADPPLDVDQIAAVVLSHLHSDHCSGLQALGFYMRFRCNRRLPLLAHPDVSAKLWEGVLAGGMAWSTLDATRPPVQSQLSDYFDLISLNATEAVRFGPFTIECRLTRHSVPTTAFRIRAAGRCLGYSADTAFDPTLIHWLSTADLILHETGPGPLHTAYERLAELPAALRERMRLIHYPDDFDSDRSMIEPLRQGESYAV